MFGRLNVFCFKKGMNDMTSKSLSDRFNNPLDVHNIETRLNKNNMVIMFTSSYSPNGRFLVQETFPKTLPRFVLILISLQKWHNKCVTKPSILCHSI